ncbi:hypothetical protein HAX54_018628, partial [Datura stramonium]|nr:hypothetical protein [Datura stramonium]
MTYAYSTFDVGRTPYDYNQDSCFQPSSHHGCWGSQSQCLDDQSSWDEHYNSIQDWNLEPTFDSTTLEPSVAVEEDTRDDENLCPNIDLVLRKVIDEASIKEVNEELK